MTNGKPDQLVFTRVITPATVTQRIVAGCVALGCVAVLVTAALLQANPRGFGTHTKLGLPPCGWIERADLPCPTCGMTTAFAHAADGHLLRAVISQPLGFVLSMLTAMTFWIGLYIAFTGSAIGQMLLCLWRPSLIWIIGGLALVSWIYKILAYKQGWA